MPSMLSLTQLRTIQWEREVADLSDSEMMSLAEAMMNLPHFWTELSNGQWRSDHVEYGGRSYFVVYSCLNAEDDIVLEVMQVQ